MKFPQIITLPLMLGQIAVIFATGPLPSDDTIPHCEGYDFDRELVNTVMESAVKSILASESNKKEFPGFQNSRNAAYSHNFFHPKQSASSEQTTQFHLVLNNKLEFVAIYMESDGLLIQCAYLP